nr:cytochrome c oxidase subunit 2A [uncultured Bacillus sp.]
MAQPKHKTEGKATADENTNLKGTLASVFLVGFVIIATWVSVYFVYLDRF